MDSVDAPALVGKDVINGTGAFLGTVSEVVRDAEGRVTALLVRERAAPKEWTVEVEHVLAVGERVFLKGPRQGFHIAPTGPARAT